jgi:hypothetical protein
MNDGCGHYGVLKALNSPTTKLLNELALEELAAVEIYIQISRKVTDVSARMQLDACQESHSKLFDLIAGKLSAFGESVTTNLFRAKSFSMLFEDVTGGDEPIILNALEEYEEKKLRRYSTLTIDTDEDFSAFTTELLAGQEATYARIQDLIFRKGTCHITQKRNT